jgi:protease-4
MATPWPPPPPAARPRRPGWVNGCLILLIIGAFLCLLLVLLAALGGFGSSSDGLALGKRVGLIRLDGTITDSEEFLDELKSLQDDPRVAALVVRIDSPGGGVAATQEMYHGLVRFHEKTGRPVVASLGSLAASGGYYTACAAQKIVTEPGTLTGSIGVIMMFPDASELLRKIGVRMDVVKSGPKKDFTAFWRERTPAEQAMLDSIVGDVYDQFTQVVADSRDLPLERVRELADGRILTGRQAVSEGLADTLGYQGEAVRMAAEMAGLSPDTQTLSKQRFEPEFLQMLRRFTGEARSLIESHPRLEYR